MTEMNMIKAIHGAFRRYLGRTPSCELNQQRTEKGDASDKRCGCTQAVGTLDAGIL